MPFSASCLRFVRRGIQDKLGNGSNVTSAAIPSVGIRLLAAFVATLAFVIPLLMQIEEPITIVLITQVLKLTMEDTMKGRP